MARKDKYNKLKPEVKPITYVLVGLAFVVLLLTIILSIPTKKEKFNNAYNLDKDNNFVLTSSKKIIKKIESGERLVVIITNTTAETNGTTLLPEVQKAFDRENPYGENKVSDSIKNIYYVDLSDFEVLGDFFTDYKIKNKSTLPLMLAFDNNELVLEYDGTKHQSEISPSGDATVLVRYNVKDFFKTLTTKFEEE